MNLYNDYVNTLTPEQKGWLVDYFGNIDLSNRPQVRMPDGSTATVRSMSFNDGNREVLVPTVADEGYVMDDKQAADRYFQTGKYLGKFIFPEDADWFAQRLHEQQDRYYLGDRYER